MAKKENIYTEETKDSNEIIKRDKGKKKDNITYDIINDTEQINSEIAIHQKQETNASETIKYKTEKCKILSFNPNTKEIDVNFKGYGIRLKNAVCSESDFILVKYSGEIGKPNFICGL